MANLNLVRWEKFVPNIGDNKALERPFFLRIKAGMTKVEFKAFVDRWLEWVGTKGHPPEGFAAAFEGVVTFGDEALVVEGDPINGLADLARVAMGRMLEDGFAIELAGAVRWLNAVEGEQELFFERLSGGAGFTSRMAPRTAAAPDGSETRPS